MGGSKRTSVTRGLLLALTLIGVMLAGPAAGQTGERELVRVRPRPLAGAVQGRDPWQVISPEEVRGVELTLRSSMTTQAPLEWSSFQLALELTGAGAPLIIHYGGVGSGYRLRIEPGGALLESIGSPRAGTLGSVDFPKEERRIVLRVENGVHELSLPRRGVILAAQGAIERAAPITFATEQNQIVNFTNVVIRSLSSAPPPAPVQGPEVHRLEPSVVVVGERVEARLVGRGLDGAALTPVDPRAGLSVEGARGQPGVFVLGAAPGTRPGRQLLMVTGPGGAIGRVPVEVIAAPVAPLQPLDSGTPVEQVAVIALGAAVVSFLGGFKSGFWSGRLARWIDSAQQAWQRAIEVDLPSVNRPCAWACRPKAEGGVADWEFRQISIEALPEDGRRKDDRQRVLAGDDLAPLQDLARLKALLTSDSDARAALEQVGDGFENAVRRWRDAGRSPAAVRVSYVLAKPIAVTLELVHREPGEGGALEWKPKRSWKRKLGAKRDDELAVIRGPGASGEEELARMRTEFLDALLELAKTVRWTP